VGRLTGGAVALAAALLVAGCANEIEVPSGPVLAGTWGGNDAGAIVSDSGAHVHIGCTAGDAKEQLRADSAGRFSVLGLYNVTLYPVARGPDHPARFSGTVVGNTMTLTVTLTDTAVTLGPVVLGYGRQPTMGACPICSRPEADARPPF
jgi:hypothetical protein